MTDLVVTEDNEVVVHAFPDNILGMVVCTSLAGTGLFLLGFPTSNAATRVGGLILFLIGVIIFIL